MVHPFALCALLTVFFLLMRGGLEIIIISRGGDGVGGAEVGAGAGVHVRDEGLFKLGMATVALGFGVLCICTVLILRTMLRRAG
ncbi:uncharacterized protein H6S33_005338 [Morchella sextelata]|uniref:uncharacterized protein n=1 Tax=Morchella sextelata TaxID=1174677 RepID=UPI001D0528D8|nr:uncharacterized protein H6S33_005338 [Morchella sextelata]KAH0613452.1 hypothetical protein H6S33_005338 [Morchella sextelata]